MAARPAEPLGADSPLFAPHRARIDALAQRERIERQALGELVDRRLQAPGAGRIARAAHGASRPGVGEDVVLRGFEIRALVERLGEIADPGAEPHAGRAVAFDRNRGQRPVSARADPDALVGGGPIARVHLLLGPRQRKTHRRARPDARARPRGDRNCRASTSSRSRRPCRRRPPAPFERQVERLRKLAPHAGGVLGRNVDGQSVGRANRRRGRAAPCSNASAPACGIRLRR